MNVAAHVLEHNTLQHVGWGKDRARAEEVGSGEAGEMRWDEVRFELGWSGGKMGQGEERRGEARDMH